MDWLMGRTKRKDKDSPGPTGAGSQKLYLDEIFSKETIHHHMPNLDLPNLGELVTLPFGVELNEWVAWHKCSSVTCPSMSAPGNTSYSWIDDKGKKCKCPAPQYIDYVTTFIQKTITDPVVFPTKYGEEFPPNFIAIAQKIHKYMFQVLAHIYYAHYQRVIQLQLHGHLNTFFAHFMLFTTLFKLMDDKDTDNMRDLTVALNAIPIEKEDNRSTG